MTRIKICGICDKETAVVVSSLPVDYIGFVFADSRRKVDPVFVRQLKEIVPSTILKIGVFVNEDPDRILAIGKEAGLDGFQLHGDESPAMCRYVKERSGAVVFKAWRVRPAAHENQEVASFQGIVDGILLDTFSPSAYGGTGERFAWEQIADLQALLEGVPVFVAGGLSTENIDDLLKNGRIDGVDVSSGVETDGRKDPGKIREFVMKVRDWDAMAR